MIDLHTHILPTVDDGATDLSMSLAMGNFGVEHGVTKVAATPHFYSIPDWSLIKEKVSQLQSEFDNAGIPIELVAGAEIFVDNSILELDKEDIPTYGDGGKYSLIEFPMQQVSWNAEQVIFHLQVNDITPIIAHPERYRQVVEDPEVVLNWINLGCLIQMNAGSILGRFGSKVKETSEIMLTHNMVHFVASDAHGLERRRLNLPEAYEELTKVVGEAKATDLVRNNPNCILEGDFHPTEEPLKYKKKKRFFFF